MIFGLFETKRKRLVKLTEESLDEASAFPKKIRDDIYCNSFCMFTTYFAY